MATTKEYTIVQNKRTGKYGIKKAGHAGWWITPEYEAMQGEDFNSCRESLWVKKDGMFGYLDVVERRELVPCEYGFPLYFQGDGYAEAWKDYKAGVINSKGEVVVPIIYDELTARYHAIETEAGNDMGHQPRHVFCGFAGFMNDGSAQAYDEKMQPCEFTDEEKEQYFADSYEWSEPENTTRSIDEIEGRIREEYVKWRKMGGGMPRTHACSIDSDEADAQKQKVVNLVYDRRHRMNKEWVHSKANADRIMRTNDLLQRAVVKAIKLGKKTAKSVDWMNKVANLDGYGYETEVFVYPQWTNSKSVFGYQTSRKKDEADRLNEEECHCHEHIWNIIAALSDCYKVDGVGACFYHSAWSGDEKEWNVKQLLIDDGQSWDELIHYPAYMDCYFLTPFHNLYCDLFIYSLEDIAQMNDFRVRVNVRLETRESNKH